MPARVGGAPLERRGLLPAGDLVGEVKCGVDARRVRARCGQEFAAQPVQLGPPDLIPFRETDAPARNPWWRGRLARARRREQGKRR